MAKKKSAPEVKRTEIPDGFRAVRSGEFAPFHDFITQPVCIGVVRGVREGTVGKGKAQRSTRYMDLDCDGREVTVGERADLKGLFDHAKIGQTVMIAYEGKKKIPGKPQPMMVFSCAIKDEAGGKRGRRAARGK